MINDPENWPKWATEPVIIEQYDPGWPMTFLALSNELKSLYQFKNSFEHIGSTAIPNLPAKPIIDLLLPVDNFSDLGKIIVALKVENWNLIPPELDRKESRRTFVKVVNDKRFAHLHLIADDNEIERHVLFRDILRQDVDLTDNYGKLKIELAGKYKHDREAYTIAKSDFIKFVLDNRESKNE